MPNLLPTTLPRVVGLTGNIGSGKSSVADLFAAKGAAIIDADALAKEATQDQNVLAQIARKLGPELISNQQLDREATAALVFHQPDARAILNSIIHPWVGQQRDKLIAYYQGLASPPPIIILDVPLLYEVGMDAQLETVIVVAASLETRVQRVMSRSKLSAEQIKARDKAQLPLANKIAKATYVIDNEGSLEDLVAQVDKLWDDLLQTR